MQALFLSVGILFPANAHGVHDTRVDDLAALMPRTTLVYVEAPALGALLARAGTDPLARALAATPIAESLAGVLDDDAREALEAAREMLGGSIPDGLGALLAQGAAFGVSFKRGTPDWTLVTRAADALELSTALERALGAFAARSGAGDALARPAETIDGADVWYIGDAFAIARRADLLVIARDEGGIRGVLDRADSAEEDLAGDARFASARSQRRTGDLFWAWIDVEGARTLSEKLPENKRPLKELEAMSKNPGVHALLGTSIAHIATADTLALGVRASDARGPAIEIELRAGGLELPVEAVRRDAPPLPNRVGECASWLAYRDLAGMYAQRAELYDPKSLPEIQAGIAGLALFFGGVDFGDEILPRVSPWYRVVVRAPEFAANAKPEIQYPAGALLIELLDAERDGPAFVSAFQSFLAVVNVDLAQKRKPALRIALEREGELQVSVARRAPPQAGDGVDQSYNLVPACALVGSTFVVGTHESVVRGVVRDLAAGRVERQPSDADRLRLDGPLLAAFLEANLGAIALASSLDEGKPLAQAELETRMLRDVVASVRSLDARLERTAATSVVLRVTIAIAPSAGDAQHRRSEAR